MLLLTFLLQDNKPVHHSQVGGVSQFTSDNAYTIASLLCLVTPLYAFSLSLRALSLSLRALSLSLSLSASLSLSLCISLSLSLHLSLSLSLPHHFGFFRLAIISCFLIRLALLLMRLSSVSALEWVWSSSSLRVGCSQASL